MRVPHARQVAAAFLILAMVPACKSKKGGDGPNGPSPSIGLAVVPGTATVEQGGSASATVTLTRAGGYGGAVTITAEGAPAGVTATVGTPQGSGTSSTAGVAIGVGAAVTPGNYPIVLRAQGSGVTAATATLQLSVTPAPDFSLAVSPATVSLVQGAARNDIEVAITRTNFTGPVTLALTGPVPAGVAATFAPAAPTATSATLSLTVGAAVTPGSYPLQVAGTGAPGTRTTALTLTVTQAGSFVMTIAPAGAVNLPVGGVDASRTITIVRTNYAPEITLVAEGLPAGVTASFAPQPVAGNSSVLTLTAAAGIGTGGPHTITIRGTGPLALRAHDEGALDATAATTLQLNIVPAGSFTLGMPAPCVANFEIRKGTLDDRRIVQINRTNYANPVQFSVEGLPPGLTVGFDANPVTGDAVRLRFLADPGMATGVYPLVVRGTGPGGVSETFAMSADVRAVSDPSDPNQLTFDFTANSEGWYRGFTCAAPPYPPDWGIVIYQEQMFVLDGRGPGSNRTEPNAWLSRVINLPATTTLFRFDASAHPFPDNRTRVRIRVVDGTTSTVILSQLLSVPATGVRSFQTLEANLAPWAGKTIRLYVEQLDDGASHGQLWLDTFRVLVAP